MTKKQIFNSNLYFFLQLLFILLGLLYLSNANGGEKNPFDVDTYGNCTQMINTGDTRGKVPIRALKNETSLYGVGALESLKGEITIINGRVLISRGAASNNGKTEPVKTDAATLLAMTVVKQWKPIPIPSNIDQTTFEAFLLKSSAEAGIPPNVPFPFMVKGELKNLKWHVVYGMRPSSQQGDPYNPEKKEFEQTNTIGTLVGFYTAKQFEGVISHPGKFFHIHFADAGFAHAGHVDQYEIGTHATLSLPKLASNRH